MKEQSGKPVPGEHESMEEVQRRQMKRIASQPSIEAWIKTVRARKEATGIRVGASVILRARDADRK